jgi:hypothetical protein
MYSRYISTPPSLPAHLQFHLKPPALPLNPQIIDLEKLPLTLRVVTIRQQDGQLVYRGGDAGRLSAGPVEARVSPHAIISTRGLDVVVLHPRAAVEATERDDRVIVNTGVRANFVVVEPKLL